jgi:hypothetical protein
VIYLIGTDSRTLCDSAHSIADDVELQDSAMGAGAMAKIISIVMSLQTDATKDQPENLRARLLEVGKRRPASSGHDADFMHPSGMFLGYD